MVANGTAPFNYQWIFNNTNLIGATNAILSLTSVQTNDAGAYAVVVTNIAGSVTSSNATLTVNVPASITTQPVSQTVIAGQNVSFTVVPSGTAPFGYQWTFNNTNLDGATNAALSLTSVSTNNAGIYAVVVTNVAGLVVSSNATLTVINPVANLSFGSGSGMTAGGFVFNLSVTLGSTYVVLASTNLQNWIPLMTNVAASSNVVITDATATNHTSRFYQVVIPQ